jgi:hypothetical protein
VVGTTRRRPLQRSYRRDPPNLLVGHTTKNRGVASSILALAISEWLGDALRGRRRPPLSRRWAVSFGLVSQTGPNPGTIRRRGVLFERFGKPDQFLSSPADQSVEARSMPSVKLTPVGSSESCQSRRATSRSCAPASVRRALALAARETVRARRSCCREHRPRPHTGSAERHALRRGQRVGCRSTSADPMTGARFGTGGWSPCSRGEPRSLGDPIRRPRAAAAAPR